MIRGESGPRRREKRHCAGRLSQMKTEVSLGPGPLGGARLEKLEE